MKVFAINGSPRDNHNTAKLLDAFISGVISADNDAEVKRIDLYKYNYKGCTECFACKVKGSDNYGTCCYKDDITDTLKEVSNADIVVFGSPVYFGGITGQLMCFLERLFYQFTAFKKDSPRVIAPRNIKTAFVHTMNISEEAAKAVGYEKAFLVCTDGQSMCSVLNRKLCMFVIFISLITMKCLSLTFGIGMQRNAEILMSFLKNW